MITRKGLSVATLLLASALATGAAQGDIYTWVDDNGIVNVSNLRPPAGADVTRITVEKPQAISARNDAAREAARQAELQALNDRVRELETANQAPQRVPVATTIVAPVYVPVPTPVMVPYAQDVVAQDVVPPAASLPACDPTFLGCITSATGFYAPSVIVLPTRPRRSSRLPKP
ncbi:MAG TPA: DUF4124 domain-containing protein, partial [Casimicrobiaceae bacterium]|nr:DUF4124 domain-containing protein [Casimicrobiaceae bacterium]